MSDATFLVHTVYGGLIRAPKMLGVPSDFFGVNFAISMIAFILSPPWVLIGIPVHFIGLGICLYDDQIFKIISVNPSLPPAQNKDIWGVKTYEPY